MSVAQFTVEDTFTIRGRGLVIHGIRFDQHHLFKAGDRLSIQRPDGSEVEAVIQGVEPVVGAVYAGEPPPFHLRRYGVLIDVDDVPIGSVVMAIARPV
jgi:hypothetical protein